MKNKSIIPILSLALLLLAVGSCKVMDVPIKSENKALPSTYNGSSDTTNSGKIPWRQYFTDANLVALIDTALRNNQELNIALQEINVAQNEIRAKKGEYMPFGNLQANAGPDRSGKYTWNGQSEEDWKANPEKKPKYLGDFGVSAVFSWELDVWKKLRTAKKAAVLRYLASVEGRNYMVTNLIAEIANTYYELLALDNHLAIVQQNIDIQENAVRIIKQQKDAARVSQLAVNRFEAQLLNTKNLQYDIQQQIVEMQNKLNFLTGAYPKTIVRNPTTFNGKVFDSIGVSLPTRLLENRPDIRQAEQELAATKLDIAVARAAFYPNIRLSAGVGLQAFNPTVLLNPQSSIYNIVGDLMGPLINRNAITATYLNAGAKQVQAVYAYEQTILKAYIEVVNQLSGIDNFTKSLDTKSKEVDILTQSITISDNLFKFARADYLEVLLTQRESLDSKLELIEIKKKQLQSEINVYKALGGGWR